MARRKKSNVTGRNERKPRKHGGAQRLEDHRAVFVVSAAVAQYQHGARPPRQAEEPAARFRSWPGLLSSHWRIRQALIRRELRKVSDPEPSAPRRD